MKKEEIFAKIYNSKLIEISKLKDACWGGIPNKYRFKTWLYLMDLININNNEYENELEKINRKFEMQIKKSSDVIQNFYENIFLNCELNENLDFLISENFEEVSKNQDSIKKLNCNLDFKKYNENYQNFINNSDDKILIKIIKQIKMDIERLETFNSTDNYLLKSKMMLILLIIAERNPIIGYLQGMADLLQPFILIYKDVSMSFITYSRFIESISDNLVDSQEHVYFLLEKISQIFKMLEPELYKHFKEINLKMHLFAYRWISCFFIREFPLKLYLRILDTYFSVDFYKKFPVYLSVAILSTLKKYLKRDFENNLIFLQSCKQIWKDDDLNLIFSKIFIYHEIFGDSYVFR